MALSGVLSLTAHAGRRRLKRTPPPRTNHCRLANYFAKALLRTIQPDRTGSRAVSTGLGIRPSADVAMQLAQTEMDLGKYAEAAEHLDYALTTHPPLTTRCAVWPSRPYTDVLTHVAKLNIVATKKAPIWVSGRRVGHPIVRSGLCRPGKLCCRSSFGNTSTSKTLLAEIGKEAAVSLVLQASQLKRSRYKPWFRSQSRAHPSLLSHRQSRAEHLPGSSARSSRGGHRGRLGLRLASNSDEDKVQNAARKVGVGGCATRSKDRRMRVSYGFTAQD